MKIVQTFWSKPFEEAEREKGLQQAGGWCNPLCYYQSHALSCLSLRQFYDQVELYTDAAGRRLLVDELQLPYTAVHLLPAGLDDYPSEMWALGKIFAYREQHEPFLHVDNDVFIWQPFPAAVEGAEVVAQSYERDLEFNRANVFDVMLKAADVPAYMQQMATTDEANVGIIGGSDTGFIRRYAEEALRFARANVDGLPRFRFPFYFNTIFEQYLLTCLAASEGREIVYAFPEVDSRFSQLVRFDLVPSPQWYIHPCGPWKKAAWVGEAVAAHLLARFPEAYRHIVRWFGDKHPEWAADRLSTVVSPSAAKPSEPVRLSIVVPAWNAEQFIGRCMQSLSRQTYRRWEVWVVDDGSTDATAAEVERWAARDGRVRLVRTEHRGVAAARNCGLAEAHAELVAFVDADDYLHPQFLELMVQALDDHREADMSMTISVKTEWPDDASLAQRYAGCDAVVGEGSVLGKALFLGHRHFAFDQCHTCHGKVFRRRLLEGLVFPEQYSVYEDAVLMNRLYRRVDRFVMVRQRLYFWMQHPWRSRAAVERGLLQGKEAYTACLCDIPKTDSVLRAACLQRIFLHCAWLLRKKDLGHLKAVTAGELHKAVAVAPSVCRAMQLSEHIPDDQKELLLGALHSSEARIRIEAAMGKAGAGKDQTGVGPAPKEATGLVSVIVAIYNKVDSLPQCLESILAQQYRNLEIILVDDGSADGSAAVGEACAARDSRIVVVRQERCGLAEARNAGLRRATGEYVIWPDAADTLHPRAIGLMHAALQQGDFPFVMVSRQEVQRQMAADAAPPLTEKPSLRLLAQRDLLAAADGKSAVGMVGNKLYRRSAVGRLRFEDAADVDAAFHERLFVRCQYAVLVDAPLYYQVCVR